MKTRDFSEDGDLKLNKVIYSKNVGLIDKGYIKTFLREKMKETKREVGRAVRDSIRENKKKRKYGGVQSHIEVFNGKVTTLTTTLKNLIDNPS
jgi:hypothetical protein